MLVVHMWWYLGPSTPSLVHYLLSFFHSGEHFGPKFDYPWELLCSSVLNDVVTVWPRDLLYLHTIACTNACGTFYRFDFAPSKKVDL